MDMGGTATRWVLLGDTGHVQARGEAPGATGLLADPGHRAAFVAALEAVRAALPRPAARAHLGLTGVGFTNDPAVSALCADTLHLPVAQVSHENDMALAWRAAFGAGPGHLVLAGTGSVGMSRLPGGETLVVGGHGALIDDAGSASWIALNALRQVLRRIDETGQSETPLAQHLFTAIGGTGWEAVRRHVYAGERGRIGLLARAVAGAATAGDAAALAILDAAADDLARLAHILIDRCGPAPLVFTGGVLALHPAIPARLSGLLAAHRPELRQLDAALAAAQHALERT
ncbi:MAG: N-acetylglucosamine kinase [Pararhodobacter sp.]|nr:N-acetylglucosamine kinase [Pararhodobacter sp.]